MKKSSIIALVAFVVALGMLFTLNPRTTKVVQSKLLDVVSPFLRTGSLMQKRLAATREGLKKLDELTVENQQLLVQVKELKATNQTLRDMELENNKLRRALQYRERSVFKLVPARIVARDAGTWWQTVKIDKGFDDGVDSDMPVLTEDGLVGKTTTVASHMATVVLIADETCKVAAMVEGTREQGIARGERTSTSIMPEIGLMFLSKNAGLQPGQKVYTSGVGGVYPSGVFIGGIKKFETRPLDGYATIVPAVDLANLQDVFVVAGKR
jgi:rod shape-determining protein MreC